eukprot:scaffold462_cov195-Pinguiococcus_pyrenoidosus.AAC.18
MASVLHTPCTNDMVSYLLPHSPSLLRDARAELLRLGVDVAQQALELALLRQHLGVLATVRLLPRTPPFMCPLRPSQLLQPIDAQANAPFPGPAVDGGLERLRSHDDQAAREAPAQLVVLRCHPSPLSGQRCRRHERRNDTCGLCPQCPMTSVPTPAPKVARFPPPGSCLPRLRRSQEWRNTQTIMFCLGSARTQMDAPSEAISKLLTPRRTNVPCAPGRSPDA